MVNRAEVCLTRFTFDISVLETEGLEKFSRIWIWDHAVVCCRVSGGVMCPGPISLCRYNHVRLQTHSVHRHMATLVGTSAQEVMDTAEEKGGDEMEECELDELLAWTTTLSFEE